MINVEKALQSQLEKDPYLEPYAGEIRMHLDRYNDKCWTLVGNGDLKDFADGYLYFGFHRTENGWVFREWLPAAEAVWLMGDFNYWNRYANPLTNIGGGVWQIELEGKDALKHGQCVKLVVAKDGVDFDRIPVYMTYCIMDENQYKLVGRIWDPEDPFQWTDQDFYQKKKIDNPLIYEVHVGMAQEHGHVGSYMEFAQDTLNWVKEEGYNTIQMMAIQEHPYYASFGYQVTNLFAPSSRYGTPDELRFLINKAHEMGIAVILDVVHSHACPNIGEGLNLQDGSDYQYFLSGERGWHSAWKTRIFNYGKDEVIHLLLSNLKYWQEEFHFDGFRFDGVTSMMYEDHGLGVAYTDYSAYYSYNTNVDARIYLSMANQLIHEVNDKAITIAEDVSGFPGMGLPLKDGGMGFDYRLSMGVPDMWIKLTKDQDQNDWDMFYLWHELTTARPGEKTIAYCESHDQAMVGDKTLIFRMADAEMYTGMDKEYHSITIDRAIDMHKLIRLLTCSLANSGYLTFMGNEFGHPEWIDFPREGNNWSYHYARRQWSLVKTGAYKYSWLAEFEKAMLAMIKDNEVLGHGFGQSIWLDNEKKVIIFKRNELIFAFNLHPSWSQDGFFIATVDEKKYQVILSSDDAEFGGFERIDKDYIYQAKESDNGKGFRIYLPCRTALVLKKK